MLRLKFVLIFLWSGISNTVFGGDDFCTKSQWKKATRECVESGYVQGYSSCLYTKNYWAEKCVGKISSKKMELDSQIKNSLKKKAALILNPLVAVEVERKKQLEILASALEVFKVEINQTIKNREQFLHQFNKKLATVRNSILKLAEQLNQLSFDDRDELIKFKVHVEETIRNQSYYLLATENHAKTVIDLLADSFNKVSQTISGKFHDLNDEKIRKAESIVTNYSKTLTEMIEILRDTRSKLTATKVRLEGKIQLRIDDLTNKFLDEKYKTIDKESAFARSSQEFANRLNDLLLPIKARRPSSMRFIYYMKEPYHAARIALALGEICQITPITVESVYAIGCSIFFKNQNLLRNFMTSISVILPVRMELIKSSNPTLYKNFGTQIVQALDSKDFAKAVEFFDIMLDEHRRINDEL